MITSFSGKSQQVMHLHFHSIVAEKNVFNSNENRIEKLNSVPENFLLNENWKF